MRISTTTLESYRLWSQEDQDWMPESDLLDSIKGVFKPTRKMMIGQAFGRAIEKADKYRRHDSQGEYYAVPVKGDLVWEEFTFPGSVINPCLEKFDRRGVFEVRHTREYGSVTVVAKVDQLLGTRIKENKLKAGSQFDFDRYQESYQWRFMLDIFRASAVDYNVFITDEEASELKDIAEFSMYPYPELHQDCCALLTRFLGYVAARGLEEYLQPNAYQSAAI